MKKIENIHLSKNIWINGIKLKKNLNNIKEKIEI